MKERTQNRRCAPRRKFPTWDPLTKGMESVTDAKTEEDEYSGADLLCRFTYYAEHRKFGVW